MMSQSEADLIRENRELRAKLAAAERERDALAAALERVLDAAKSYRSDVLGLSKDGPNDPRFAALSYAPKWVPRDLSIHIAETCDHATILAERDRAVRRKALEDATVLICAFCARGNTPLLIEEQTLVHELGESRATCHAEEIHAEIRRMAEEPN